MAKGKDLIGGQAKAQFYAAGRIARELGKWNAAQRKRIMEIVNETDFDVKEDDPRQEALPLDAPQG